jgi:hypothetical protein
MIVPQYWAQSRIQKRVNSRQVTVKRFGWSDESETAAKEIADKRANEAVALIESGKTINKSEPKIPYNGADGVPIREEIVSRHRDSVITRNSYGALCINTPDVLFADIDFDNIPSVKIHLIVIVFFITIAAIAGFLLKSWAVFGAIAVVSLIAPSAISNLLLKFTGGAPERAKDRIKKFSSNNPEWHLRIYRTPAGYRVLAMHRTFDPNAEDTIHFFSELKSDPVYVQMCKNQRCFRARVSPKPWRIGIESRMKPRPGVWPINPARMPERERWVKNYDKIAHQYASCRFEEEFGSNTIDPKAEYIRSIHDDYCKTDTDFSIA